MKFRGTARPRRIVACSGCVLLVLGCGASTPPVPPAKTPVASPAGVSVNRSAVEPVQTWEALRSGRAEVTDAAPVAGTVTGYARTSETETFRVTLPTSALCERRFEPQFVAIPGEWSVGILSAEAEAKDGCRLWVRRRVNAERAPAALQVDVTSMASIAENTASHGERTRITAALTPGLASSKSATAEFYGAVAEQFATTPLAGIVSSVAATSAGGPNRTSTEWSELVASLSGYESVEASLQADTRLRVTLDPKRAKVPLKSLTPPVSDSYPWERMLAKLSPESRANLEQREPLSRVTPAEFYWVRAENFSALQALSDEADSWVTPAFRLLSGSGADRDLAARYRAQLGLTMDAWSQLLGNTLVRDLAIVGSDPFVRQGSDVSVLLRPSNPRALVNALNAKALLLEDTTSSESEYRGTVIIERRDASGLQLRQYTAHLEAVPGVGPLTVVSNSPAAVRRILDVALDQRGALAGEPDFQYMLARDAQQPAQVLAFAGERFIHEAVSPVKRILDARRQIARAELTRVSYAALLFGWLEGRPPHDVKELTASPWLKPNQLRHFDGQAIQFEVGSAPHSPFGAPEFLTPLLDLPAPAMVSSEEQGAYQAFAESYSAQWRRLIDPVALRVQRDGAQGTSDYHLRVLPLLLTSADYSDILQVAGDVRVSAAPAVNGVQMAMGIAAKSPLRDMLTGRGQEFLGHSFGIDWLGDWLAVGVADSSEWVRYLRATRGAPELTRSANGEEPEDILKEAPAYALIDVKRRAGAALVIAALRKMAEDALGEGLEWKEYTKVSNTAVMRIAVDGYQVFYALTKDRLIFAGQSKLIERLIQSADRLKPTPVTDPAQGGQLDVRMSAAQVSPLVTALIWGLEQAIHDSARSPDVLANALLRGAYVADAERLRRLAFAYLGYMPVTVDNRSFELSPEGLRDPERGNALAPVFPPLPVAGSAAEKVLGGLRQLTVSLALDQEPGADGLRSLRTRVQVARSPASSPSASGAPVGLPASGTAASSLPSGVQPTAK